MPRSFIIVDLFRLFLPSIPFIPPSIPSLLAFACSIFLIIHISCLYMLCSVFAFLFDALLMPICPAFYALIHNLQVNTADAIQNLS